MRCLLSRPLKSFSLIFKTIVNVLLITYIKDFVIFSLMDVRANCFCASLIPTHLIHERAATLSNKMNNGIW